MSNDLPLTQTLPAKSSRSGLSPTFRLVVAWFVTLAILPYAWARTLVYFMMVNRPDPLYLGLTIAGVLAVIGLTFGL
jgi:hypothetical protein